MKNNKGQVTIFIILAILLVAGIIAFLSLRNNSSSNTQKQLPEEIQEVEKFVEQCLKQTLENGLIEISGKGGYFSSTNYDYLSGGIPFYLKDRQKNIPSTEFIESELEYYVDNELFYCVIEMYSKFPNLAFNEGDINSEIEMDEKEISVSIDYDLTVTKENVSYQIKDYEVVLPSNLKKILYVADEIVNMHLEDFENIQLTALYDLGEQTKIYIDLIDYENSLLYTLTDFNTEINNRTYTWNFIIE